MRSTKSNLSGSTLLDEPESGPPIYEDPARPSTLQLLLEYARASDHDALSLAKVAVGEDPPYSEASSLPRPSLKANTPQYQLHGAVEVSLPSKDFIYTETASDTVDRLLIAPETSPKAFVDKTGTLTRLTPCDDETSLLENSWDLYGSYKPIELTDFNIRGHEHTVEADLGEQASQMADDCEKVNPLHVQQLCYTLTDMLLDIEVIASSGDSESCGDSEEQSDTDQSLLHLPFSDRVGSPSVRRDDSLHDTEASPAFADPVLGSGSEQASGRRRGGDRPEDQQRDSDCTVQPPNNKKRRGSSDVTGNHSSDKRRRLDDKHHDGHDTDKDDEDNEDSGHGPSQSGRRSTLSRGRPFACPCWKRDPLEFTRCHEWKTKDIDSVRRVSLLLTEWAHILTQQQHIEDTHREILSLVSDRFETVRKTKMAAVRKWHAFYQTLFGDDKAYSSRCAVSPCKRTACTADSY